MLGQLPAEETLGKVRLVVATTEVESSFCHLEERFSNSKTSLLFLKFFTTSFLIGGKIAITFSGVQEQPSPL